MTIADAAHSLGIAPSTLHRWLGEGFIAGEQITPGAPWRIRVDDALRARFAETTPEGYVPMVDATGSVNALAVPVITTTSGAVPLKLVALVWNVGEPKFVPPLALP